jgi:hypothetical protein
MCNSRALHAFVKRVSHAFVNVVINVQVQLYVKVSGKRVVNAEWLIKVGKTVMC